MLADKVTKNKKDIETQVLNAQQSQYTRPERCYHLPLAKKIACQCEQTKYAVFLACRQARRFPQQNMMANVQKEEFKQGYREPVALFAGVAQKFLHINIKQENECKRKNDSRNNLYLQFLNEKALAALIVCPFASRSIEDKTADKEKQRHAEQGEKLIKGIELIPIVRESKPINMTHHHKQHRKAAQCVNKFYTLCHILCVGYLKKL